MAEKNKGGRPSKWDSLDMPSKLDSVTGWAKQGATDEEMCLMLGVSTTVFYEWKNDKPEFAESIKKGKEVSNGEILNSAFKQCVGYEYEEEVPVKLRQADGSDRLEMARVKKFAPPNPTMTIFMLKNRLPKDYRDKQEIEHSTHTINVTLPDAAD